jgi:hypothetical protein
VSRRSRLPKVAAPESSATKTSTRVPLAGRDQAEQNADSWWWSCAMQAVESMAATGRNFQAHDVAEEFALIDPDDPRCRWGALMGAAHRLGIVEPFGVAMSSRRTVNGSLVRTWRGVTS